MMREEMQASSYRLATALHQERVAWQVRSVPQRYRLQSHELVEQEAAYTGLQLHTPILAPVPGQKVVPAIFANSPCVQRIFPTPRCVAQIRDSVPPCDHSQTHQAVLDHHP